ncbi:MEDS domain-containing protein [Pseudonocardia sp. CA-142604]|uniref:MEDS domain-containing protein n=1 Tax=Pseudonocardia sp. CA-142604 TaxID=3240024 RepID=UPI003D89DF2B
MTVLSGGRGPDAMAGEMLDIGIGDYRVSAGAHIWALYEAPAKRDAILRSFVRSALLADDKCICVTDGSPMVRTVMSVGDGDIDVAASSASGQLELINASDITGRSGEFSVSDKIDFWKAAIDRVKVARRHQRIRFVGDMSSALLDASVAGDVIRFESALNGQLLPLFPQVHMCMYDLDRVAGAFVVDLISAHPKVYVNDMLVENPYSMGPEEWLKTIGK